MEDELLMLGEFEGWTEDDWSAMPKDRHCPVQAYYDGHFFDAVIIQAVPDIDDGVNNQIDIIRSLIELKNYRADHLITRLKSRVRRGRARFPPMEKMTTASETETDVPASPPQKKLSRPPLFPLSTRQLPPPRFSSSPAPKFQNAHAYSATPTVRYAHSATSPARPAVDDVYNTYDTMRRRCIASGLDPSSNEGVCYFMAALMRQVSDLSVRLEKLENQRSIGRDGAACHLDLPVFKRVEDFSNIPPELSTWMRQEGGDSVKDHVHRILNGCVMYDLQLKLNRTGTAGKTKFPEVLEKMIFESAASAFPGTTRKEVETQVVRFLKNAADRPGGRQKRRLDDRKSDPVEKQVERLAFIDTDSDAQ